MSEVTEQRVHCRNSPLDAISLLAVSLCLIPSKYLQVFRVRVFKGGLSLCSWCLVHILAVLHLGILGYIKALILSAVHDLTPKYNVPIERVLPPIPAWVPEAAPAPSETSLCIGTVDRTDETCPLALRPLFLEVIAKYGRRYALAYSVGSSTGGTGKRGRGIYILWPDGTIFRACGPVIEKLETLIAD
ncbi:hypothetical protein PoB_005079000 [Plakobranchus ocellatus]|uniref:Uncharacterized protein n=1 Tax=Plakobranchus ocellatus TaxID=259542 RepID=A0AAV4BYQ7_9GAST|nr:hypothetical protein PoB_005079000 [Plakobranchus ocellatus]